jgi:hypothetical protein
LDIGIIIGLADPFPPAFFDNFEGNGIAVKGADLCFADTVEFENCVFSAVTAGERDVIHQAASGFHVYPLSGSGERTLRLFCFSLPWQTLFIPLESVWKECAPMVGFLLGTNLSLRLDLT